MLAQRWSNDKFNQAQGSVLAYRDSKPSFQPRATIPGACDDALCGRREGSCTRVSIKTAGVRSEMCSAATAHHLSKAP